MEYIGYSNNQLILVTGDFPLSKVNTLRMQRRDQSILQSRRKIYVASKSNIRFGHLHLTRDSDVLVFRHVVRISVERKKESVPKLFK